MTFIATHGPLRLRSVITIAVAVWMLIGVAGWCALRSEPFESNPAHAFFTSPSGEFAVNADHGAAHCAMSPACPRAFAMAVLPPWATALVALGTAVVVITIIGSVAHDAPPARRAPPRGLLVALTGQDVLTRLSLARR
jgi:hypothetical protein